MQSIVNPQISDAVTSASVQVLGSGPGSALANLYQATGQALGLSAHNSTAILQNGGTVMQATTTQGVSTLYGVTTATESASIVRILNPKPTPPPVYGTYPGNGS